MSVTGLEQTADELRAAFDASFAVAIPPEQRRGEDVLLVRARDLALALRRRETLGIVRCPRVTTVPSARARPALLGIVGVRGTLTVLYDLAALADGRARAARAGWLAICGADRSIGLFFDTLEGHARLAAEAAREGPPPTEDVVHVDGHARSLISVPRIIEDIRGSAGRTPHEE